MQPGTIIQLSKDESDIVFVAGKIGFGELRKVSISPGGEIPLLINTAQERFITSLRTVSETFFDTILVHDGIPVQAEIFGELRGINYVRKIRFS